MLLHCDVGRTESPKGLIDLTLIRHRIEFWPFSFWCDLVDLGKIFFQESCFLNKREMQLPLKGTEEKLLVVYEVLEGGSIK